MDDSNISHLSLSQQYNKIQERIRYKHEHLRRKYPRQPSSSSQVQPQFVQPVPNTQLLNQNTQLQSYIEQLCAYINQSSAKYSRNVETLTNSYRDLYMKLSQEQTKNEEERLLWKNQITVERDMRLAREQELDELRRQLQAKQTVLEDREQAIQNMRKEAEQRWEETHRQKQLWTEVLSKLELQQNQQNQEIISHKNIIKEKDSEIQKLIDKVAELEADLAKKVMMPDKIQNCEKRMAHDQIVIINLKEQLVKAEKQRDFLRADISRAEKQRQEYKIKSLKYEQSFESFFTIKIKEHEDKWSQQERQLNTTIDRLKLQLENNSVELKKLATEKASLAQTLQSRNQDVEHYKRDLEDEKAEKASYLSEFRQLKKNYESAINDLQQGFKAQQQKNWHLEDQKKDLEEQIDRFRELVKEIANINDFATAGTSQYYVRQISKLQQTNPSRISRQDYILAREQATRELGAQRFNKESKRATATKEEINRVLDESDDDSKQQWDKLLKGINELKIPKKL